MHSQGLFWLDETLEPPSDVTLGITKGHLTIADYQLEYRHSLDPDTISPHRCLVPKAHQCQHQEPPGNKRDNHIYHPHPYQDFSHPHEVEAAHPPFMLISVASIREASTIPMVQQYMRSNHILHPDWLLCIRYDRQTHSRCMYHVSLAGLASFFLFSSIDS
jgi:hypothetical protein